MYTLGWLPKWDLGGGNHLKFEMDGLSYSTSFDKVTLWTSYCERLNPKGNLVHDLPSGRGSVRRAVLVSQVPASSTTSLTHLKCHFMTNEHPWNRAGERGWKGEAIVLCVAMVALNFQHHLWSLKHCQRSLLGVTIKFIPIPHTQISQDIQITSLNL